MMRRPVVVLILALLAIVAVPAAPQRSSGASGPIHVLVAAPPRMGTTWLFNAVRILVRYHDPNMISGFSTSFLERDICYWKMRNVSLVIKTHALNYGWMLAANCSNGHGQRSFVQTFDKAVTSYRDPYDTACSLVNKDGSVQRDMFVQTFYSQLCE